MSGPGRPTLVLVGANGMLAQKIHTAAADRYRVVGLDLPDFDLTDPSQVQALAGQTPEVIVNCAAMTDVDGCEDNEEGATLINGAAVGSLAAVARDCGATLVHISTDYVFDGLAAEPYTESDQPSPASAYGRSKLAGERAILDSGLERYFIVRTSWLYGPGGKNFVETMLRLAAERDELRVVADQVGSPTYTGDLAQALLKLLQTDSFGIYHFANSGSCSWHGFAEEILSLAGEQGLPVVAKRVVPIRTDEYPLPAERPAYSVLSTEKYTMLTGCAVPDWCDGLKRYMQERSHLLRKEG